MDIQEGCGLACGRTEKESINKAFYGGSVDKSGCDTDGMAWPPLMQAYGLAHCQPAFPGEYLIV